MKTHVGRVLTKAGLRDRAQAVVLACETGLVQPGCVLEQDSDLTPAVLRRASDSGDRSTLRTCDTIEYEGSNESSDEADLKRHGFTRTGLRCSSS